MVNISESSVYLAKGSGVFVNFSKFGGVLSVIGVLISVLDIIWTWNSENPTRKSIEKVFTSLTLTETNLIKNL